MANDLPQNDRIPVTLLTGFLGSGKTTLLNAWLRSPELSDAAVIVNEFGEVGVDHALIASSSDNTIELSTGCLCCTVRGDLVDTLRELIVKREKSEVRAFDRVIIETTGLADPAPVIQALMTFPVARRFRLRQVVTTVDAANATRTFEQHPESIKQAAVADEIVVTKTDLDTGGSLSLKSNSATSIRAEESICRGLIVSRPFRTSRPSIFTIPRPKFRMLPSGSVWALFKHADIITTATTSTVTTPTSVRSCCSSTDRCIGNMLLTGWTRWWWGTVATCCGSRASLTSLAVIVRSWCRPCKACFTHHSNSLRGLKASSDRT